MVQRLKQYRLASENKQEGKTSSSSPFCECWKPSVSIISMAIGIGLLIAQNFELQNFGLHPSTTMKEYISNNSYNRDPSTSVAVNTNSSLALENVISIEHNPSIAQINVHLKKNRPCRTPHLLGRLSGKHLSIIKWDETYHYNRSHNSANDDNIDNDVLTGYYQVPSSGLFHLEILMLLCNSTLAFEFGSHTNLKTSKDHCLESPYEFRITSADAHVIIREPSKEYNNTLGLGSWSYQHPPNQDFEAGRQIFTRFQPQNCRGEEAKNERCTHETSLDRFEPFQFKWNAKSEEVIKTLRLPNFADENELFCVVGWSHTRLFMGHYNFRNPKKAWHKAKYTREVNEHFVNNMFDSNCTKIVFSLGQWDAVKGATFDFWHDEMSRVIALASSMNEKRRNVGKKQVGIFIIANHYNPLGDVKLSCPPQDLRSPPFIDMYNSISKDICKATGQCKFVDTNAAVIGPMWDSAPDLCHYSNPAKIEVLYALCAIYERF